MTETVARPWAEPMPEEQFARMREILAAPSPINLEAAMTEGVLLPMFESFMPEGWQVRRFRGNASIVVDTQPGRDDLLSVMLVGHADKIRLQVRSIGDDGKIWVDSDSFLPVTLIGHRVKLFSEDPDNPGHYRVIEGGTIEAIGAIHFADPKLRSGDTGLKKEMLYLELGIHGEKKKEQVEKLGIRAGDAIILDRPIRRAFSPDTFHGAYLDNGLGCFVVEEVARIIAQRGGLDNIRILFGIATHEEIGRFGSRVLAGECKPDVLIGIDVNHDYVAAPGVGDKRFTPLAMGKGFSLSTGAIASEHLNAIVQRAARERGIPYQKDVVGRDTGTDAMAAVLAGIDAAATSIGFPIRNMHTISELAHTGDVLAAIWGLVGTLEDMHAANDGTGLRRTDLETGHPRLDTASPLAALAPEALEDENKGDETKES
ncbi:MAG: M20/M25/M40 family metallo-hydrolase [Planctomycetota bacterium]|nr:MAG: M20/M25/M40 family metallo-hydrolase [Planctomycetota bacterium]